jgi:hypothetical protein
MMERASPKDIKQCMEAAESMANAGLRFVPIPAVDEADHLLLLKEMFSRLLKLDENPEEL